MKRAFFVLIVIALFVTPLFYRAYSESAQSFELAKHRQEEKDYLGAALAYKESASWRFPLNSPANRALEELRSLSQSDEISRESRMEVRRLLYETLMRSRTVFDRNEEQERERLLQELLEYAREKKGGELVSRANPFNVHEETHILIQIAFWCWIFSVGAMIRYGFTSEGQLLVRPCLKVGGVAILFFLLWLYLLSLA